MDPADYNLTSPNTTLDKNNRSTVDFLEKMSIALYSIIFAIGIIANGFIIWIAGFKMKKTISAVWFLNLAIADFLCCATVPLYIAERLYNIPNILDVNIFCILIICLFYLSISASVLFLTAMSIDRCVLVMCPFWAKIHRTCKLVSITVAVIWMLSLFSAGLVLYSNRWCIISRNPNDHIYIKKMKQITRPFRLVMLFVIPFLIILTSYMIIFFKLRKSKRSQRSQRPYRIITTILLSFFICWFPYYIWPLTPRYNKDNIEFHIVNAIVNSLACFNCCINPIIYVFMSQDFRQGFLRSISASFKRTLGEPPDHGCREREEYELAHTTDQ